MKKENLDSLSYEIGVLMVIADAIGNESLVDCTNAILNSVGQENINSDELNEGIRNEHMNRYPGLVSDEEIRRLFVEELMMSFGFDDENEQEEEIKEENITKQQQFDLNFKDIILEGLNKAKELQEKTSEPFYSKEFGPSIDDDFMDALNKTLFTDENKDLFISEENIESVLQDNTLHIDGDGYPYVVYSIKIKDIPLIIDIQVYHHSEWDFYLK